MDRLFELRAQSSPVAIGPFRIPTNGSRARQELMAEIFAMEKALECFGVMGSKVFITTQEIVLYLLRQQTDIQNFHSWLSVTRI